MKENTKDVFKKPLTKRYFGKVRFGCPYFWPRNYVGSIVNISVRKTGKDLDKWKQYGRNKNVKFTKFGFDFYIEWGWPIHIKKLELGWKDKFNTPRHEWNPAFYVYFFGLQYTSYKVAPHSVISGSRNDDRYWEQWLWYTEYYDEYGCDSPNIKKAKDGWGWVDGETKKSTWDNSYLTFYGQFLTTI